MLTWVSVKLSRACITDCSGLEAWDYKRGTKSVFSVGLEQVMGRGPYVLGWVGELFVSGRMVHLCNEVVKRQEPPGHAPLSHLP